MMGNMNFNTRGRRKKKKKKKKRAALTIREGREAI